MPIVASKETFLKCETTSNDLSIMIRWYFLWFNKNDKNLVYCG